MNGNQSIGEEEGFDVGSNHGFHDLADWEQADWSVIAGIRFCILFLCRAVMFADFQADGR